MQTATFTTKLIFSNKNDEQKMLDVLTLSRDIFNFCSEMHYGKKIRHHVELHHLTYYPAKTAFPIAKSQLIIKAEEACVAAYRTVKSNKHHIIKPLRKKRLSLRVDQRLCSYRKDRLVLTTLGKRIKVDFVKYPRLEAAMKSNKFCNSEIFVRNGKIYIGFVFQIETTEIKSKLALGVDLGIRRLAATSDGQLFIDKEYNAKLRKIRYLKRCLQRVKTLSAKRHLKQIRHKERNVKKDFNHHLCNAILKTKADTIVLEDLDVIKLKKKKHAYSNKNRISQVSFGEIRHILSYKAALRNKVVVCVNPAYTSQRDSVSGKLEGIRQGCRFYSTNGLVYDSDINAAVNIAKLSKLPILSGNILHGQAVVNRPYAKTSVYANFRL